MTPAANGYLIKFSKVSEVAQRGGLDKSLTAGITAVAFMTVQQVGLAAFKNAKGEMLLDRKRAKNRPTQVLRDRAVDDSQGLFGFLRTVDKKWTVTHDENDPAAKYKPNHAQDLAWGAEADRSRNWREPDARRIEGPIPVECRSASCGTCWVGVLGGAEKLSDVAVREGKKIKEFGYIDTRPNQSRSFGSLVRRRHTVLYRSLSRPGMACLAST